MLGAYDLALQFSLIVDALIALLIVLYFKKNTFQVNIPLKDQKGIFSAVQIKSMVLIGLSIVVLSKLIFIFLFPNAMLHLSYSVLSLPVILFGIEFVFLVWAAVLILFFQINPHFKPVYDVRHLRFSFALTIIYAFADIIITLYFFGRFNYHFLLPSPPQNIVSLQALPLTGEWQVIGYVIMGVALIVSAILLWLNISLPNRMYFVLLNLVFLIWTLVILYGYGAFIQGFFSTSMLSNQLLWLFSSQEHFVGTVVVLLVCTVLGSIVFSLFVSWWSAQFYSYQIRLNYHINLNKIVFLGLTGLSMIGILPMAINFFLF
ncbi:MAG: hypothetical protein GF313_15250 [Caldithrix sp.]|nr:hypothetical protein [Caldithrix sp.]